MHRAKERGILTSSHFKKHYFCLNCEALCYAKMPNAKVGQLLVPQDNPPNRISRPRWNTISSQFPSKSQDLSWDTGPCGLVGIGSTFPLNSTSGSTFTKRHLPVVTVFMNKQEVSVGLVTSIHIPRITETISSSQGQAQCWPHSHCQVGADVGLETPLDNRSRRNRDIKLIFF